LDIAVLGGVPFSSSPFSAFGGEPWITLVRRGVHEESGLLTLKSEHQGAGLSVAAGDAEVGDQRSWRRVAGRDAEASDGVPWRRALA